MPTVDEVSVHVRAVHRAEVDSIVAFARAVVPPHYAPILGDDAAEEQLKWWTADRIGSAVAAGRVHVAVADDAIVGVAETGALGDEQVIWKLYLAPGFRGRGLGSGNTALTSSGGGSGSTPHAGPRGRDGCPVRPGPSTLKSTGERP